VFCMLLLLIFLSACSEKKNSHSIHIEDLPSQKTMEFSNGDQSPLSGQTTGWALL
jgi:hypothetical protein